jgi:hypothetical protein
VAALTLLVVLAVGAQSVVLAQVDATEDPTDRYYPADFTHITRNDTIRSVSIGSPDTTLSVDDSAPVEVDENQGESVMWMSLVPVVIGGLLSILGGIAGTWLRARYAHKMKFAEELASRKVRVYEEAYWRIKNVESLHSQAKPGVAHRKLLQYEEWFWKNRLYLPIEFSQAWIELRTALRRLYSRIEYGELVEGDIDLMAGRVDGLMKEAIDAILKASGNRPLVPGRTLA